ncbi:MAG TPA: class I SAM-dependent methyltransferase [Candidatus Binataceae bacterium]|nr:class I SAM-dependent methyltransferase [Candidatus Binataceae bacterium]
MGLRAGNFFYYDAALRCAIILRAIEADMTQATTPTSTTAESIHQRIREIYARGFALGEDDQPHDTGWGLAPARGEFVFKMCRESGASKSLEVGFAFGISTLCILAALAENGATGISHVAMDPFQASERFRNAGLRTLREAGVTAMVDFHRESSETLMPRLTGDHRQFDFILIDGDHAFDHTFVDIFYAHRLLKPGGVMVIDDINMPPVYLATRHLLINYHYELIGEAFGSHSDATQSWRGETIPIQPKKPAPESTRNREWIRAYRKPLTDSGEKNFWGQPFDDFMRFWVDDFHDPETMESFQRRNLNSEGLRSLASGNKSDARRYLLAAIARDPTSFRSYLRLAWTFLPRAIAKSLATRSTRGKNPEPPIGAR